jgi:hypothetical protein
VQLISFLPLSLKKKRIVTITTLPLKESCIQIMVMILDKFRIKKIYPTSEDGREWFVNMNNPKNDSIFSITSYENISRQSDGSWRIAASKVRMNINTPIGESP